MQYASVHGKRVEATPHALGTCPICEGEVVSKCGEINVWHWAHRSRNDCDKWSDGESLWHLNWKRRFPKQWREAVIGEHRADVATPQGVIELQASSISAAEITEREEFYGKIVWVIQASTFHLVLRNRKTHVTFRWKYPHRTWLTATKPLYFDRGNELIEVRQLHEGPRCAGWGILVSYKEFVSRFSRPKFGEQLCEDCLTSKTRAELIETDLYEYYTLDLDPSTLLCHKCYAERCDRAIPEDPSLFDCYTPLYHFG